MPEKKPFLTYEQQIRKLRDEKGLAIPDEPHAIEILTQTGYFSLFFRALEGLIQNHPDNAVFPKIELIKSMGFPAN
ncbi:hypothetical protein FACS1894109_03630 [Spirochaetia bacterium]|nr:hypothetical protein FACS1894109_03630 [Spirochaetia bacterium]